MPLDIARTMALVHAAEARALEKLGAYTVTIAKSKAPVRHLGGKKGSIRYSEEYGGTAEHPGGGGFIRVASRGQKRQPLRLGTDSIFGLRTKGAARLNLERKGYISQKAKGGGYILRSNQRLARYTGFELSPAAMASLDARGRYEVRRGRAVNLRALKERTVKGVVRTGTVVEIGGRLKNSIFASDPVPTEGGMKVEVIADPVDEKGHHYAKYVEFPTRHNAAQPFLRPALKSARQKAAKVFEGALKEQGLR